MDNSLSLGTSLSLHLLKHHPDTLRAYVNNGKIFLNSNGVFVIRGTDAEQELAEYVQTTLEWVVL